MIDERLIVPLSWKQWNDNFYNVSSFSYGLPKYVLKTGDIVFFSKTTYDKFTHLIPTGTEIVSAGVILAFETTDHDFPHYIAEYSNSCKQNALVDHSTYKNVHIGARLTRLSERIRQAQLNHEEATCRFFLMTGYNKVFTNALSNIVAWNFRFEYLATLLQLEIHNHDNNSEFGTIVKKPLATRMVRFIFACLRYLRVLPEEFTADSAYTTIETAFKPSVQFAEDDATQFSKDLSKQCPKLPLKLSRPMTLDTTSLQKQ